MYFNISIIMEHLHMSRHTTKPVYGFSGKVPYMPGCATKEDDKCWKFLVYKVKGLPYVAKTKALISRMVSFYFRVC